jgi:hypothetical protein
MVRDEREPENDHSQSDAPMATDGDRHADDGDDECDQLNKTNDREPDDSMSNDDDDANCNVNDHSDDDDDDDADVALNGGDDPVCKSCGNFGHRSHRDHKCPNHHCAVLIDGTAQHLPGRGSINGAFMHGHCNVALSRVRNRESLAILVDETNLVTDPTTGKRAARTTNIVCRKILDM